MTKPRKHTSCMSEDELVLFLANQQLTGQLESLVQINSLLNQRIDKNEQDLKDIRASTLYNRSEYMLRHHVWISKFGTFILGCVTSPAAVYFVQWLIK